MPSLIEQARQLRQERAGFITQARAILDTAQTETRELSQEEENQWDTLMTQADER